ncbi:ABC transporter permease [[Clostridium] fimetarium]|uniref:FtsX-like permease family protein n=1 Tax=[Clostridium] fimetarium TaxID=99656 RepID=A0A1I0R5K6_9FIRM|nr:ABC transporter permease [[Clostridium] fimetarium]SEW35819.1 FtsX-like permease family protein [[Clostridium] fimetarium]
MWIKKLKKKKLQFIVLGFILAFATMILSTCISFSKEVERYTDSQYDDSSNASLLLYATPGTSKLIQEKSKERDDITSIKTYECYYIASLDINHHNTLVQSYINPLYAIVLSDYTDLPFKLTPVDGDLQSTCPAPGQVWVQNIVADNHSIFVNDTFDIKVGNTTKPLTVSTLVNDTRKPVSMTTGAAIFINQADTDWFDSQQALELICITTDTNSQTIQDWLDTVYTDDYHAESYDTLSAMKLKATMITSLISSLGTLSAGFMLIMTIVIILFFIRNTILNEYSAIGTYKSVGYTNLEIMGFYQKCYALVGIISITIGSLLGLPMSIFIGRIVMEYIGDYSLSKASIYSCVFVILITSLILIFSIWFALRRIRKITPVDAFRVGTSSSKAKLRKSLIKNAHSSFSMAINDIFKYKSRSAIIVLIVGTSFFIAIMLVNICISFGRMEKNAPAWISGPNCDCFITKEDHALTQELIDYVQNSDYVDSYITGELFSKVSVLSNEDNINIKYANVTDFNTFDYKLTGITYRHGRPPQNKEEVAIDSLTLKNTDYDIGDYITLVINGVETNLMISGIYDTMMPPSLSFVTSTFSDVPKELYYTKIGVNLKNPKDIDAFRADIKEHFSDYKFETMLDFVDDIKVSIMSIMIPVTIIIIVIFFAFTLLNIINIIVMNNNEQQRNFGIMKAYGFSNGYIIRRNVFRLSLLSALGLIIATILNLAFTHSIYYAVMSVNAYKTEAFETTILLVSGLSVIILITILLSLPIKKISPKKLMEE